MHYLYTIFIYGHIFYSPQIIQRQTEVIPDYNTEDTFGNTIIDFSATDRAGINGAFSDFAQLYADIVRGCSQT
jgi:hypothetical protein